MHPNPPGAGGSHPSPNPVLFYVPLMPFERQLLSELQTQLDQENLGYSSYADCVVESVFEKWEWTSRVKKQLRESLQDWLSNTYGGDRRPAYDDMFYILRNSGRDGAKNTARVQDLKSENTVFISKLGDRPVVDILLKPRNADLRFWSTLTYLYETFGKYWKQLDPQYDQEVFDIRVLLRKFTIQWRWHENLGNVDQALVQNALFESVFRVERRSVEDGPSNATFGGLRQQKSEELVVTRNQQADVDEKVSWAVGPFLHLMSSTVPPYQVEDPRSYVHFIPWNALKRVSWEELQECGMNLEIPFSKQEETLNCVLWTSPATGFLWNHHLYTEDEVYQYNIAKNWSFPDHYYARHPSQILFSVREIGSTDFIRDLRQYWENWNDCAITRKSPDDPLLLLETLPGMRFRSRMINQDELVARTYFRNLVYAHENGASDNPILAEIAGADAGKKLVFSNSLRVIAEDELADIQWDKPIGKGQNGAVYAAIWQRPLGILATTQLAETKIRVVLKDVLPRTTSSEDPLKKLLKELDITYASLGGRASGCIEFLGVTLLTPKHNAAKKPFLVFERATESTINDFLAPRLRDASFLDSWFDLINAVSSIAIGLKTLHEHGVLHRDLHQGNVLVTLRQRPTYNPGWPSAGDYDYLLSDVGEGKLLSPSVQDVNGNLTTHIASYGDPRFRAPEVHGSQGWTVKADVWAFGIIVTKLLDLKCFVTSDTSRTPPDVLKDVEEDIQGELGGRPVGFIVPRALKEIVEPCLSWDPARRPDMRNVAFALGETGDEIWGNGPLVARPLWTWWDWNESVMAGTSGNEGKQKTEPGWNNIDMTATQGDRDDDGMIVVADLPELL